MSQMIRAECQKPGCDRGFLPGPDGKWKLCPNCNMGIVMVPDTANMEPDERIQQQGPGRQQEKRPTTGGFNIPIWPGLSGIPEVQ